MLRVLPITKEKNLATWFVARQVRTWVVKHATALLTRFAAMGQDRFYVSVARFTVALKFEDE